MVALQPGNKKRVKKTKRKKTRAKHVKFGDQSPGPTRTGAACRAACRARGSSREFWSVLIPRGVLPRGDLRQVQRHLGAAQLLVPHHAGLLPGPRRARRGTARRETCATRPAPFWSGVFRWRGGGGPIPFAIWAQGDVYPCRMFKGEMFREQVLQ